MNNIQNPNSEQSADNGTKPIVMRRYLVGQIITIAVAHYFRKDYGWSEYTDDDYIIVSGNTNHLIGENVKHKHERIRVRRKELKSGYMIIRGVKNAA